MPSSVCIITARGGSKRIPRKNVREFCGKPMLAYSVETAVASGIFDVVMVSTDDDEIAEMCIRDRSTPRSTCPGSRLPASVCPTGRKSWGSMLARMATASLNHLWG